MEGGYGKDSVYSRLIALGGKSGVPRSSLPSASLSGAPAPPLEGPAHTTKTS